MGAIFVKKTFKACDEKELQRLYSGFIEDCNYNHGHDAYAGVLRGGLTISQKEFKKVREIEEYVENASQKWGPAIAVRVGDFKKAFYASSVGKRLAAQIAVLQDKVENFDENILKKLALQKSLFKACPHCASKISIKHYLEKQRQAGKYEKHNVNTLCPVCSKEFLKNQKMIDDYKKASADFSAKRNEYVKLEHAHNLKLGDKKPYWFVGGWAAE